MKFILLGHCRKPHGIKGGFSLHLINAENSVLTKGMSVFIEPENDASSLPKSGIEKKISSLSLRHKGILYLDGIDDRTLAEEMIPFSVSCDRELFPKTSEGEVYLTDLIGLEVFCKETGKFLGCIDSVGDNGVQDILRIKGEESFDLLFIDQFVHDIDLDNQKVIITKPEFY